MEENNKRDQLRRGLEELREGLALLGSRLGRRPDEPHAAGPNIHVVAERAREVLLRAPPPEKGAQR